MPELPEVEVVKRGLEKFLSAKPAILGFDFYRADLRTKIPKKKLQEFVGAHILNVERRAKYLIFTTEKGKILSHLGMTGVWRQESTPTDRTHDHVRIRLSGALSLVYRDPRRFGIFEVLDSRNQKKLEGLGPEPLSENFSGETLWQSLLGKKSALKIALMDQQLVVGVGNIYACEALYLAKLSPFIAAQKMSRAQALILAAKIKETLNQAILAGGSSISDFSSLENILGSYQDQHYVYGQEGKPCRFCTTKIRRKVQVGRSTFWCPVCQKNK